jgi:hypothetical protein
VRKYNGLRMCTSFRGDGRLLSVSIWVKVWVQNKKGATALFGSRGTYELRLCRSCSRHKTNGEELNSAADQLTDGNASSRLRTAFLTPCRTWLLLSRPDSTLATRKPSPLPCRPRPCRTSLPPSPPGRAETTRRRLTIRRLLLKSQTNRTALPPPPS